MPTAIRLPRLGQSMTEGQLSAWQVEPGQRVRVGDALVTIETDKAEFDVEAPVDGVLAIHSARVGQTLEVGATLGWILGDGETSADLEAVVGAEREAPAPLAQAEPLASGRSGRRARASPKARRLAAQRGLEVSAIAGTGPDGLITTEDVERASAAAGAPGATWNGRRVRERRRLGPVRLAGARRTAEAWESAPHFVQMVDADMTRVRELRRDWDREGGARTGIGYNDFVVAALARALAELPELNAAFDAGELVLFADVNIGVAVDTPRGLVVPVIARADTLSLGELAGRARDLAEKARRGTLGPADTGFGTATVSNLGAYGIRAGTPVLNAPEAVLVFVGAVEERVVVREGAIAARPLCTLSIAYDHRVTDGAAAARLTTRLRDLLTQPDALVSGEPSGKEEP